MAYKTWISSMDDEEVRLLNLSRKDLSALPADKLIDIIAWQQNGLEMLDDNLQKAESEILNLRSVINQLSIDPNTGVFTSGALAVMTDVLIGSRILEFLKIQGFTLKMCLLDVDGLKTHNSLGGHEGGDIVLNEVAKRLKLLYRRRSDVVAHGLADFIGDVSGTIRRKGASIGLQARAEKGDEMVAWRFAAPTKNDIQRGGWRAVNEVARVKQCFQDATVSYALVSGLDEKTIKKIDPQGRYKIHSGIVTAPISITFACVYSVMPTSRQETRRIVRKADQAVMLMKHGRDGRSPTASQGVAITFTDDDLNLA